MTAGERRAVVIGVGNPFRRDDGAGPEVASRVRAILPGVEVVELDGDPAGLMDTWEGADIAVVVDAVRSPGCTPGDIHRVAVGESDRLAGPERVSSHRLGPGDAVDLARALDRLPGRLVLYGVEAASFDFGQGLTPAVEASIPLLVERVVDEVSH